MTTPVEAPCFLGIKLSSLRKSDFLACLEGKLEEGSRLSVSFIHSSIVLAARRDRRILDALNSFDTVLADGIAVVWGARYLGIRVPERLGTDDVALEVMEACGRLGLGLYFLGADPGVAERAAANLRQRLPRLKVVGTHHGWFEPEKDAQIVEIINTSGADCLLVCLGTPRQQLWVAKNAPKLHARLIMTGGGYLDHLAEAVDWYPKWIHRLKLNWLYRLWREPRRLWRRYTIELLEFAWLVVHARKSAQAQG